MNSNDFDREFLDIMMDLRATTTPGFLAVIAFARTVTGADGMEPPEGYTRGDFKRAIKVSRSVQNDAPKYAATIEKAVALIRRDWLNRGREER